MGDTTVTPTSHTAATDLLALLCAWYPETFTHEGDPPRPLAIGITERLITELALDAAVVKDAMRLYTRRRAYQAALREPGAMRVGLDGTPTEPVTPEHQAAARTPRTRPAAAQAQARRPAGPVTITLDLWKGLTPMSITATLKLVLRDMPETRESNGLVYMALTNEPRGLPKGISLDAGPLYLSSPLKPWKTACTRAEQIRASGTPALLIVEAHVATMEGALVGVVKTVQVVEGKPTAAPSA